MRNVLILTCVTVLTLCTGIAQADLRSDARQLLIDTDRAEQVYKQFYTFKVSPNVPAKVHQAATTTVNRAQAYANTLPAIRLYAGKVAHGDESKATIQALQKCMYTNRLALNELEEAVDNLKAVTGQ